MSYPLHDRALGELQGAAPDLRDGGPNHGPMVVESLAALGRDAAALPWAERYRPRLAPGAEAGAALAGAWREALGDTSRLADWEALFRQALHQPCWPDVLEEWLPRLIPGAMATGTHGVIRCGHAVRALRNRPTQARLDELARALAYCAVRYRPLSAEPVLAGPLSLEDASAALPRLGPEVDRRGPPPKVVRLLDQSPDFAAAVNRLAPPDDAGAALVELAAIGARLYLANAERHPLVLLHAVTGPAALLLAVEHASPALQRIGFAYMWQAVAAWAGAFGAGLAAPAPERPPADWDEIVRRAVETGDAHAIKLTEACHRLSARHTSTVFQAAAWDWVGRLEQSRDWDSQRLYDAGIIARLA